ncbi:MAG: peptide chain release factor N(5)-glutamine methyltransferase [Treponema sp.]|nr:peptide chain release factor N(5)-glutamine methyltransferase [Treponema sp.]
MTVREALNAGKAGLAAAGIENPALDAALLLAEVLGVSRSSLLVAAGDLIGETALVAFEGLVGRRAAGECVAYILGRKEFYGLEFLVSKNVLVPRPDTETLVEAALARLSAYENRSPRMLDLCTGSGAVVIAVRHRMPGLEAWATDVSPDALEIAESNVGRLLPPGSVRFRCGNLFQVLPDRPLFHLITGNPPYVPSGDLPGLSPEVRAEPALALDGGIDGLDIVRGIVSQAPGFLHPGGTLMLEADPRQMREIAGMFEGAGFTDVQIHKDLSGMDRVIEGRK